VTGESVLAGILATTMGLGLVHPSAGTAAEIRQVSCSGLDGAAVHFAISCAEATVPQLAGVPAAGHVTIPLLHIHARHGNPRPDPVMLLHGGPGSGILGLFRHILTTSDVGAVNTLLGNRRWIIFDQRGGGASTPTLTCAPDEAMSLDGLAICARRLGAAGVRLDAYNSVASAHDIKAIRRLLGLGPVHLYGLSYGSRLAHVVARLYPRSVRSIVHDGPMRPDNDESVDDALGVEAAFRRIVDLNAAPGEAASLWRRFEARLDLLDRQPAALSGRTLTGAQALAMVRDTIYGPGDKIPADTLRAIRQVADGAWTALVAEADVRRAALLSGADDPLRRFALGQALSVDCNEEKVFESPAAFRTARDSHGPVVDAYLAGLLAEGIFEQCALWPSGKAAPVEQQAFAPAHPQQVFAGDIDASLSREAGQAIVRRSPRAAELRFTHMGHVQLRQEKMRCAMAIAHRFFDTLVPVGTAACATATPDPAARWIRWTPRRPDPLTP
jgi:pimeloyl-ACP methyl ester carboxylesterase